MAATLTYTQRNALAEQPALAPLPKDAFTYTPGKPEFAGIVAGILGNVGTSSDGFDALFNAVAGIVDSDIAALGGLDSILSGVGFVAGAFDAANYAPIVGEYAAFLKAGDVQVNGTPPSGPPPTSQPPPKRPPPPPQGRLPGPGCQWVWNGSQWVGVCSGHIIPIPYPEGG